MKNLYLLIAILFASFTSHAQAGGYCVPNNSQPCFNPWSTNDMIDNFWTTGAITNISNLSSGCATSASNNYSSFMGMVLVTGPGATIGLNIQGAATGANGPCPGSGCFAQGFAVWIDWNQDLDFNDPGEKIYESPSSGFQVYSGTFTVPATAICSDYRMRVRSSFSSAGSAITPCANQTYGETEDYIVRVENCSSQERTICLGNTATIDYTAMLPATSPITVLVSPMTNVNITIPTISFNPSDTTIYIVTWTSPDSSWQDTAKIYVNTPLSPTYAGLDDTACAATFMPLSTSLANTNTTGFWSFNYPPGVGSGFTFLPNILSLSPTIVANNPGYYTVFFTESDTANICPSVIDSLVAIFSTETHTSLNVNPSCNAYADGSINVTSFGTLGAIEYSIDNGATFQTSNFFDSLSAGVYNVVSRDVAGCSFSSVVTLIDPLSVVLTLSADTTVCINGTATHVANAVNGTFFNFNWSHTGSLNSIQPISPLADSTVSVYALNQNNCSSDTLNVTTFLYDPISFTFNYSDTSVCPGDNNTALAVNQPLGGLNGYDYYWTANGSLVNSATPIYSAVPNTQTTYCVTVSDACETTPVTACKTYTMNDVPVADFDANQYESCAPGIFDLFVTTTPSLVDNVLWTIGGKNYNNNNVTHTFEEANTYNVTLYVESSEGCRDEITKYAFLKVNPIPDPEFYVTPSPATIYSPVVDLINQTTGTNTYAWEMPSSIPSSSSLVNAIATYPEGIPNNYTVRLIATSDKNCVNEVSHEVIVKSDVIIYAPNVFTPNQDQLNNNWRVYIEGIDVYDFNLKVYNRWGELVWESYDPEATWDGTMLSGKHVLDGTYVWSISAKDLSLDNVHEFKGTVMILR
ncbi:GEVED domain-containing protein [Putridiphycobacter roseus]|nr:GEVED domain-containing protein [Putridiphycobacter roseus]